MLILTRRISESTRINSDIAITILGVKGSQVRLGIQAPAGVSVHREEIFDKIVDQGGTLPATVPVAAVDPRDLFIAANPIGASENELVKAQVSDFIDDRVHADYLIFLAGFQALANRAGASGRQP